ncbi:MAG: hypothetical protein ACTSX7_15200 [Alphaproteobacteria bacterium]
MGPEVAGREGDRVSEISRYDGERASPLQLALLRVMRRMPRWPLLAVPWANM